MDNSWGHPGPAAGEGLPSTAGEGLPSTEASHQPGPQHLSHTPNKGGDAMAFDLEAGREPGFKEAGLTEPGLKEAGLKEAGFKEPGFKDEPKQLSRHERWLEKQAAKQGPWGEGMQGIYVLLWLIPISGGLGYAFVLPWIHPWALRLALYIIVGSCLLVAFICLYLVHQLDPGVVTPQPEKDPEIVEAEAGRTTRLRMDGRAQWVRPPPGYTGPADVGTHIRGWERYCSTCNVWRGPRVTHCSICGYCMKRFDHHCAVVGTCIAQNNHRFFVTFLLSTGVGSAALFAASIVLLAQRHWAGSHAWSDWHTYFGLLLTFYYFYLTFLLLFGCCHLALLLCDLTSKQMAQRRVNEAFGGFSSCLLNLVRVCCAPIRPKRNVIPPYNVGQPPPAGIIRVEFKAPAGPQLEPGMHPEGPRSENGWKDLEKGDAERSGPEASVGNAVVTGTNGHVGRGDVAPGLDGSDDHVVAGDVAAGMSRETRASAEEEF